MSDDHDDDDAYDKKHADLFLARERTLEAAMPVLAEFFHIVRCPNHTKEERTAAYERACAAWDGFEESYVREVTLVQRLQQIDAMNGGRGEHAGDALPYNTTQMLDTETGKTINVHPGSRAIN